MIQPLTEHILQIMSHPMEAPSQDDYIRFQNTITSEYI